LKTIRDDFLDVLPKREVLDRFITNRHRWFLCRHLPLGNRLVLSGPGEPAV
jgi:hypothetical protein